MITVHKFDLTEVVTAIPVGAGARPLHVATQHGLPRIWVQVDDGEPPSRVLVVQLAGTGTPVPVDGSEYLGSFLSLNDQLVFHAYTRIDSREAGQ